MSMQKFRYKVENSEEEVVMNLYPCFVGVYSGGVDRLRLIDDLLDWEHDGEASFLTLAEIARQRGGEERLITVITNEPLYGKIYQWGNYGDEWWVIGEHMGYA